MIHWQFYFWLAIPFAPAPQQTYLSLQRKAKTMWRHPWSWATSKGGESSWTVGCSSHCSHILIQQLGLTEGKRWEERFREWRLVKKMREIRQEWGKKKRNLCCCRRLGNLELKRLWLVRGSPWSGFFCTSDTCAATNEKSGHMHSVV